MLSACMYSTGSLSAKMLAARTWLWALSVAAALAVVVGVSWLAVAPPTGPVQAGELLLGTAPATDGLDGGAPILWVSAAASTAVASPPPTETDTSVSVDADVEVWVASMARYAVQLGPARATPAPEVTDALCQRLVGPTSAAVTNIPSATIAPGGTRFGRGRRVIDTVLFHTELTMLEVRLHELWHVVDLFVVVEAAMTFTGKRKPLHFARHRAQFAAFAGKIVHVTLPVLAGDTAWPREHFHRLALTTTALTNVSLAPGDIVLVSDLDEIPRPEAVAALRDCTHVPFPVCFRTKLTYYAYDFVYSAAEWLNPRAMVVQADGRLPCTATGLRAAEGPGCGCALALPFPTGWHCSWCFEVIAQYVDKVGAYSHTEYADRNSPADLTQAVRDGVDIHGRPNKYIQLDAPDAPAYVASQPERFQWLLYRRSKFPAEVR
jgi:beta-1,4-mannosyl-glycoprotein beta-1,4-N-acetylglucosaminyltransferase